MKDNFETGYGVIIEKGPADWQILQQHDGFAVAELEGRIELEEELWRDYSDHTVIFRVTDENTNERVTQPVKAVPENRRFKVSIKIPAGGLYRIESYIRFNGVWEKRGDRRFHIGVGEVFVIAGQSNAVGSAADQVSDPIDPMVHSFRHCGKWDIAAHPLNEGTDTVYPAVFEKVRPGHGPWITFAKILSKRVSVPVGLIPCALGGSPLSYWNRKENGFLFDNMVNMINDAGGEVAGMLWYQGCNDAFDEKGAATYFERFRSFCEDFRSIFGNLPIITVQLNKVLNMKEADLDSVGRHYAVIREAQRQAALNIKGVYMVPSIDLPVCDGIHNSAPANLVIGQRVADTALRYLYNKSVICDAPQIREIVRKGEKSIVMRFDFVYDRIYGDNNPTGTLMFSLTDENGRMFPCDYDTPGDDSIILTFDRKIGANATVSCDRYNDTSLIPYDQLTHLPVIPFCGVKVKE